MNSLISFSSNLFSSMNSQSKFLAIIETSKIELLINFKLLKFISLEMILAILSVPFVTKL